MLFRLLKSKFRNLIPTIWLGITFLPTFVDLLYQYQGVFVPKEGAEGGIGFCFGEVWGYYCTNLPLAVCLAIGFPLVTLLFYWKELKTNESYRFAWQFYLMSFAMAFFLYEKGFRKPDFNFSWGYMYGIFFSHFGALLVVLERMMQLSGKSGRTEAGVRKKEKWLDRRWAGVLLPMLVYLAHLACGLLYLRDFLSGAMYY